ncbi:MAG: hypothetical protein JW888_00545 [Pirellulales bacterium]|nr:hypothetical protein [Pirellulales bacterium]
MDFLNQLPTQILNHVRSMTPNSRIVAGGLLLVAAIGLAYLGISLWGDSQESLFGEQVLSQDQLNTIRVALAEAHLRFDIRNSQLFIPQGERSPYLAALDRVGALPSKSNDPMDDAIDAGSIWMPLDQRKALCIRAKEKKLETGISEFPEIAKATVTLDSREEGHGLNKRTLRTALVDLTMKHGKKLDPKLGAMICDRVAYSWAGMRPEDIRVFDKINHIRYPDFANGDVGAKDRSHLQDQRAAEQDCEDRILRLLHFIPGVSVVATAVEDRPQPRMKHTSAASPEPSSLEQQAEPNRNHAVESDSVDERSATVSNRARELPRTRSGETIVNRSRMATNEEVASTGERVSATVVVPPFRVSIRVPISYFEKIWRDQDQNASTAGVPTRQSKKATFRTVQMREIGEIKRLVASALPTVEGMNDLTEWVAVVPFRDSPVAMTSEQVADTSLRARLAEYGSTLGVIVLAAAGFIASRPIAKRVLQKTRSCRADQLGKVKPRHLATTTDAHEDLSGIELDSQLARQLIEHRALTTDDVTPAPFGLLSQTNCPRIAQILTGELPQTIALVLSHLEPDRAGQVLVCFAPEVQIDVIHRWIDLEQADPEVLHEIDQSLNTRLAKQVPMRERRVAGLSAISAILDASPQPVRRQLLNNLVARDGRLAAQFESSAYQSTYSFDFEDFTQWDNRSLARLCEAAGDEVLTLALIGATEDVVDRMLSSRSREQAKTIRRSLDHLKLTRLSDVDAARSRLIELAQSLAGVGTLSLPEDVGQMAFSVTP